MGCLNSEDKGVNISFSSTGPTGRTVNAQEHSNSFSQEQKHGTHPFYRGPEDLQNTSQKTPPHCEIRCSLYKLQEDTKQSLVIPCSCHAS